MDKDKITLKRRFIFSLRCRGYTTRPQGQVGSTLNRLLLGRNFSVPSATYWY